MANEYRDSLGTLKVNLQVLVSRLEEVMASVELEQELRYGFPIFDVWGLGLSKVYKNMGGG